MTISKTDIITELKYNGGSLYSTTSALGLTIEELTDRMEADLEIKEVMLQARKEYREKHPIKTA
jgi:hypothetical protein